MRLSTRGRYSLRIMGELGKNYYQNGNNVLELNRIAKNQSLSVKYIEHIISDLRKAGLVSSERGVAGGYKLSRSPERITLFDIFQATEKISKIVKCVETRDTCALQDICAACDIWEEIQKVITDHLKTRKLTNFLKIQEQKTSQHILPRN